MRLITRLSIRDKLTVVILATVVFTLLAGFGVVILVDVASFRADLVTRTEAAARIVAEYSASELAFADAKAAGETLDQLRSLQDLDAAVLFDRHGRHFAGFDRHHGTSPPPSLSRHGATMVGNNLHVVQPVTSGGETLGTLYLCASTVQLKAKIAAYLRTVLLVLAALIGLSAVAATRIQGVVSGPILRLAAAARRVSHTADYSARLARESEDEVGELYDAWNQVLDQVERRQLEQARAEAALRRSEERFRSIIEQSSDAVYVVDSVDRFLYVNPAFEVLLEIDAADALAADFDNLALIAPDSRADIEVLRRQRASGEPSPSRYAFKCVTRTGRLCAVEVNSTAIEWDGRPARLGILRDITRRVEIEERVKAQAAELRHYADELERSNRELDQFAYVVSHDLRAPLRAISNLSTWIEDDLAADVPAETRAHLELLRRRTRRLENLISGILEYSRVGRVRTKVEMVDLGDLVREVIDDLAPPAGFSVVVGDGLPTLSGERIRLAQVFSNLIGNAVKHHPREHGRIEVSVASHADHFEFAVHDDGAGIAAEYHERIFTIFQTLQPRDRRETTGVGLAIVKKIVDDQGGRLWVESAEGLGATFRFTWPRREHQDEEA